MVRARALLARFEAAMDREAGLDELTEALELLSQVQADAPSADAAKVAANVALACSRKAKDQVEALIGESASVHYETLNYWEHVFQEFDQAGFALPGDVSAVRSKLAEHTR